MKLSRTYLAKLGGSSEKAILKTTEGYELVELLILAPNVM